MIPRQWDFKIHFSDTNTLFFPTFEALKTWFELSRVNFYRNDLRGNKNYFELAGSSSYRGFELPRGKNCSKCVKEIKGKSILVRVSARFELGRDELSGDNCILHVTRSSDHRVISHP